MVALVIAGMLFALATPSFTHYRNSLLCAQGRGQVLIDIQRARQASVTRHVPVYVKFTHAPSSTYTVHIDSNSNGIQDTGESVRSMTLPSGVKFTTTSLQPTDSLIFDPSGILRNGTTGGTLVLSGNGKVDTLFISAVGAVYRP
jgi:Tfp pilus assembly protein FimT